MPQPPQFAASLAVATHSSPQSVCEDAHMGVAHLPPLHASPAGHVFAHAPQFATSESSDTQAPAHGTWPSLHFGWQAAATHSWSESQFWPQSPQLWLSFWTLTQPPLHSRPASGQVHTPARHAAPPEQVTPQAPQLWLSLASSTQAPPHLARFVAQAFAHAPSLQTALAAQVTPQDPQFAPSLVVSTHAPPHAAKGAVHVATH